MIIFEPFFMASLIKLFPFSLFPWIEKKINTFASIFPINEPKYVFIVMLEDTKLSKSYVYNYRNKPGSFVGTPFNTAGWTSVEVAAKIIEKIGPILATKY